MGRGEASKEKKFLGWQKYSLWWMLALLLGSLRGRFIDYVHYGRNSLL